MRSEEALNQSTEILPSRARWVAIATGLFFGLSGCLLFGPLFLFVPSAQILGAVIQPYSPRPGRWLLSVGLFFSTLYAGLFIAPQAYGAVFESRFVYNLYDITLLAVLIISLLSVIWCDAVLIRAVKCLGHNAEMAQSRFPRAGDWLVWITAVCMSVLILPMSVRSVFAYHRTGRLDTFLLAMVLGLIIVLFDVALAINAVKMRRVHLSRKAIE